MLARAWTSLYSRVSESVLLDPPSQYILPVSLSMRADSAKMEVSTEANLTRVVGEDANEVGSVATASPKETARAVRTIHLHISFGLDHSSSRKVER